MKYEFLDRKGALDLATGILSQVNTRINERITSSVDKADEVHVPTSAAVAKAIQDIQMGHINLEPVTNIDEIVEAAFQATQPEL